MNSEKYTKKHDTELEESHGRHWKALLPNKSELVPLIEYWNENADLIAEKESHFKLYRYDENKNLSVFIITSNNKFVTAYPVIHGPRTFFQIETSDLWRNGLEGIVDLRELKGNAMVSCFDTTMYKNKGHYNEGLMIKANLGSIAYNVYKETKFEIVYQRKTVSTRNTLILLPVEKAPPDTYKFQTYIKRVKEISMFNKEYYLIHVTLFKSASEEDSADHYMLVLKENVENNYIPKPGDAISGIFWLQANIEL